MDEGFCCGFGMNLINILILLVFLRSGWVSMHMSGWYCSGTFRTLTRALSGSPHIEWQGGDSKSLPGVPSFVIPDSFQHPFPEITFQVQVLQVNIADMAMAGGILTKRWSGKGIEGMGADVSKNGF